MTHKHFQMFAELQKDCFMHRNWLDLYPTEVDSLGAGTNRRDRKGHDKWKRS